MCNAKKNERKEVPRHLALIFAEFFRGNVPPFSLKLDLCQFGNPVKKNSKEVPKGQIILKANNLCSQFFQKTNEIFPKLCPSY